jgi:hypothetical protein
MRGIVRSKQAEATGYHPPVEARGFAEARTVPTPLGSAGLAVYPVERVIAKAAAGGLDAGAQLSLW